MAKSQSLLDKARSIPARVPKIVNYTDEQRELVLAWIRDEITLTQLSSAMGIQSPTGAYSWLASIMKVMIKESIGD